MTLELPHQGKCVVFDVDGTLCDVTHRLHYLQQDKPDWPAFFDACVDDKPIKYVVDMAKRIFEEQSRPRTVLLFSGRPDSHRDQTVEWMMAHGVRYHMLFMRHAGDYRPDTEVKLEMLERALEYGWRIEFVVDDRPEVVRMWREQNIPCFAVDDRNWYAAPPNDDGDPVLFLDHVARTTGDKRFKKVADVLRNLRERLDRSAAFIPTHRHKNRGSVYQASPVLGTLQTDVPLTDMTKLVTYVAEDGTKWHRTPDEFEDGRFEAL